MIRPEFKTILLDQRGAAVIIWSFFVISIAIYLFISRHLLANPDFGRGFSYAAAGRAVFWLLALIDFGYYVYWKRYLAPEAVLRDAKTEQTAACVGRVQRRRRRARRGGGFDLRHPQDRAVCHYRSDCGLRYDYGVGGPLFAGSVHIIGAGAGSIDRGISLREIFLGSPSEARAQYRSNVNDLFSTQLVFDAPFAASGRMLQRQTKLLQKNASGNLCRAQTHHVLGGHLRIKKMKTPAFQLFNQSGQRHL